MIKSFKELKSYVKADAHRYIGISKDRINGDTIQNICKLYIHSISYRYVVWMRICNYLRNKKIFLPLFLISRKRLKWISYKTGIQIPYSTDIGKGFYIGHYGTMVINGNTIIGKNVNISPMLNIGQANRGKNKGTAVIGNDVYIGPGVMIVGAVRIGNNVAIGAGAVVTKDIPDNATVAGVPAKIISMKGSEGYVNSKI